MITDKTNMNSGVPSATRGRMQLVKPVQTANTGNVEGGSKQMLNQMNRFGGQQAPNTTAGNNTEIYNPIMAKDQSGENSAPAVSQQAYSPNFVNGLKASDPSTLGGAGVTASNGSISDQVRYLLSQMNDNEIMGVINGLADGSIKGTGVSGRQYADPMMAQNKLG